MKTTCVWVGAALLVATHSFAQQKADSAATLNDVVVTANKLVQKQNQTGKVLAVISKEQLEKSVGRTLGQLLNEQAGITIPGALNTMGSPQTLSLRGAGPGRTLVLVDGIPAFDPSLINSEFDLNLMSLNNIERIEIARGAQSTLYGSDAIGGVVNIITTNNKIQKPISVKATAAYGNLNTFRGNLQLNGKTKKLSYSARYARLTTDGFSSATDKKGDQNFDDDGYKGQAMSASLQYQLSGNLKWNAFVQRNLYKTDVDGGAFTDDRDFTLDSKNNMAGTGLQFKKGRVSITGNYQYSDVRRNFLNDSGHVSGFAKYVTDDYYGRNQFAELFGTVDLGAGFTALVGADYRFSSMNSQYYSLSSFGPYSSNFADTSVSQFAVYGSVIFNRNKLNIELGSRINSHEQFGTNTTYTFNPSYQLTKGLRIFGSIASGFKAPSLYQLYASFGNKDLNPEKATTYEGGLQQSGKKITNRLVYFHRNINNGIDFDNVVYSYFNINEQRVNGLEWETNWQPVKKLTINGNYTLLLGEENSQSRITTKDTSYNYLLRRPKHNINLAATYNITPRFSAGLSGKYVSERYDVGGYQVPDVKMDSYFLLNANAFYEFNNKFRVFADVQNIFNTTIVDIRGYNGIPFLINAGITVEL